MIDTIIFDFDGTLVDTEDIHTTVLKDIMEKETGREFTREEIAEKAGMVYADKMRAIFKEHGMKGFDVEKISKTVYPNYKKIFLGKVKLKPGVRELLESLHEKYKIGIYSPNDRSVLVRTLEKFDLMRFFGVIVSIEDVEKPKPDPEGYLLAAKKLGSKPENCLVFEDTPTGFTSAKGAGMKTIVLKNPYLKNPKYPGADGFIDDFMGFDLATLKKF
jgi:HAD superfamily hydrolase (TIGR01509 family)